MKLMLAAFVLAVSFFTLETARAAEPAKAEPLPPPRAVAPIAPRAGMPLYLYPRVSRYDVWQNYGVTRTGRWRPLVIRGPYGAYYRYNGEPFPWTATHSYSVIPTDID